MKSVNTIDSHVQALINRGVVDNVKNLTLFQSPHGLPTTLYDLKVFNYLVNYPRAKARGLAARSLVMRLDTDQAWEKKAKFEDEELQADSVIKEFLITAADGKSYRTKHYNLEMLIALGYRIKSNTLTNR